MASAGLLPLSGHRFMTLYVAEAKRAIAAVEKGRASGRARFPLRPPPAGSQAVAGPVADGRADRGSRTRDSIGGLAGGVAMDDQAAIGIDHALRIASRELRRPATTRQLCPIRRTRAPSRRALRVPAAAEPADPSGGAGPLATFAADLKAKGPL